MDTELTLLSITPLNIDNDKTETFITRIDNAEHLLPELNFYFDNKFKYLSNNDRVLVNESLCSMLLMFSCSYDDIELSMANKDGILKKYFLDILESIVTCNYLPLGITKSVNVSDNDVYKYIMKMRSYINDAVGPLVIDYTDNRTIHDDKQNIDKLYYIMDCYVNFNVLKHDNPSKPTNILIGLKRVHLERYNERNNRGRS